MKKRENNKNTFFTETTKKYFTVKIAKPIESHFSHQNQNLIFSSKLKNHIFLPEQKIIYFRQNWKSHFQTTKRFHFSAKTKKKKYHVSVKTGKSYFPSKHENIIFLQKPKISFSRQTRKISFPWNEKISSPTNIEKSCFSRQNPKFTFPAKKTKSCFLIKTKNIVFPLKLKISFFHQNQKIPFLPKPKISFFAKTGKESFSLQNIKNLCFLLKPKFHFLPKWEITFFLQ